MNLQTQQTRDRLRDALVGADVHESPLFRAIRDAVIVYDLRSGEVLAWNPAAEELLGYSAEEARGLAFMDLLPERMRPAIGRQLADYLVNPSIDHGWDRGAPIELPALHKSGQELTVEFSTTPIGDVTDLRVMTIVRDCTERKRLEIERERLLEAAQIHAARVAELGRLKADFTAMVAHELGTPVASIKAMIDLLDNEGLTRTQSRQIRAALRSEADMIQRLVNDIREASRFERDDFEVELHPVAVSEMLEAAVLSSERALDQHVFTVAPAPDVRVLADCERVGQILRNLLQNAAKYTPPGTQVELRTQLVDGRVRFEVEDHGPGIHQDDLSKILEKFVRGRDEDGKRKPGAGLGLYLSRRIAQAHGSDLLVESDLGRGSTFAFELEVAE